MENNIDNLLVELGACDEVKEWAKGKTWSEIYNTCHRGDWLLWLFQSTNPNDLQLLTLAKAHCANTIRHLMRNEMSIKAVDAAISFGEGKIGLDDLNGAAYAAVYAATATDRAVADAYSAATAAAAISSSAYATAAYTAAAAAISSSAYATAAYTAADADAALKKNQQETADICRKYLPIEIWNIK